MKRLFMDLNGSVTPQLANKIKMSDRLQATQLPLDATLGLSFSHLLTYLYVEWQSYCK